MGTAAYERGSKVIRAEIDSTVHRPRNSKPLNWDIQREQLRAEIIRLECEMEKARRCVTSQRAQLTIEREAIASLKEEIESLKTDRARWAKAFLKMKRRWEWTSRIIRRFVSPTQVAEFRSEELSGK